MKKIVTVINVAETLVINTHILVYLHRLDIIAVKFLTVVYLPKRHLKRPFPGL